MSAALARVLRRLLWSITVALGITILSFALILVLPGDPARMLAGPQASAADIAHVRAIYDVNGPVHRRFLRYVTHLVHPGSASAAHIDADHKSCAAPLPFMHLDLGYSFHHQKPVVDVLSARIPRSIELGLAALAVQLALGLTAGIVAATQRGSSIAHAVEGASLVGMSLPTFVSGALLQYVLAYRLRLLPYDGVGTTPLAHLATLVLPALTLGIVGAALYARVTATALAEEIDKDYVRFARSKGITRLRATLAHALRNALVPIATLTVLDLGSLVGGAVITERIFRWPGVGQTAVDALLNRDGPLVVGTVLVTSSAIVVSTIALDAIELTLDPRKRKPNASAGAAR